MIPDLKRTPSLEPLLYFLGDPIGGASMQKEEICARIRDVGIVPAVRTSSTDDARFAAEAVAKSGIPIFEITRDS